MKEKNKGFFYYFFLIFLFRKKKQILEEEEKSNMSVGIVFEHISARCIFCDCMWEAIIETDLIDWGNGVREVRHIEGIECPECSNFTKLKRK